MRNTLKICLLSGAILAGSLFGQGVFAQPAPTGRSSFYATKIQVGDMTANLRFYVDILGMQKVPNSTPGHENVVMLRMDDGKPINPAIGPLLILNSRKTAPQVGDAYGSLVFMIPDVDGLISKMKAAGARILQEPKHAGTFAVAYVADPDGRPVELLQTGQP